MKNFVVVIAVLMVSIINTSAQMKYTQEDGVFWQKIVECDSLTSSEIYNTIKGSGVFKNSIQIINDTTTEIVAILSGIQSLSDEIYSGGETWNLPFIVSPGALYSGRVIFEIKDGRYRISLYDITFDNSLGGKAPFNEVCIKKDGSYKKQYNEEVKRCLDYTFNKQLTPKPRIKDNW